MGFFDTLRRVLGGDQATDDASEVPDSTVDTKEMTVPTAESPADTTAYDRAQWQKKMKRILDELPTSRPQWAELMSEARALGFDADWVTRAQVEEFMLLIRRAVSDRRFTETEHRKLDLARELIGIPEAEAEAALHTVMAEAERFFGKPVQGG